MGTVAAANIGFAVMRRRRMLRDAEDAFQKEPNADKAKGRWVMMNILSFAHAESVTLFGLVLKFLGSGWVIAGGFFAAGLALLLMWRPQVPNWLIVEAPPPPMPRD